MSILDRIRLDGKHAFVMGASPDGMGGSAALALAEAGANVVTADIRVDIAEATAHTIRDRGGSALSVEANALDTDSVRAAFDWSIEQYGPIDCLVNVVGGTRPPTWQRMDKISDDFVDQAIQFNTQSVIRSCREAAKGMIEAGTEGRIVNFASISGITSAPYHGVYGAAKAALMSLTRTMAIEWGQFGIRVNAVGPGTVATGHTASMKTLHWGDTTPPPLHRYPQREDIASTVLFLLSDLARSVTGQTVFVDGGVTLRHPANQDPEFFSSRQWSDAENVAK